MEKKRENIIEGKLWKEIYKLKKIEGRKTEKKMDRRGKIIDETKEVGRKNNRRKKKKEVIKIKERGKIEEKKVGEKN